MNIHDYHNTENDYTPVLKHNPKIRTAECTGCLPATYFAMDNMIYRVWKNEHATGCPATESDA